MRKLATLLAAFIPLPLGNNAAVAQRGDNSFAAAPNRVEVDGLVVVPPGASLPTGQYAWEQFTVDGGASGRVIDLRISTAGDFWKLLALTVTTGGT